MFCKYLMKDKELENIYSFSKREEKVDSFISIFRFIMFVFFMGLFDSEAVRCFILQFWQHIWISLYECCQYPPIQDKNNIKIFCVFISTFMKENLKYIIYENRN